MLVKHMVLHLAMVMTYTYQIFAIVINLALQIFLIAIITKLSLIQIINKHTQLFVEIQKAIILVLSNMKYLKLLNDQNLSFIIVNIVLNKNIKQENHFLLNILDRLIFMNYYE